MHNYSTKSPLVPLGRPKFTPKTAPCSTLSGPTDTQTHTETDRWATDRWSRRMFRSPYHGRTRSLCLNLFPAASEICRPHAGGRPTRTTTGAYALCVHYRVCICCCHGACCSSCCRCHCCTCLLHVSCAFLHLDFSSTPNSILNLTIS